MSTTTIRVKRETKKRLEKIGLKTESFDDIINDILHERNFYEIHEYTDETAEDFRKELDRIFNIIKYEVPEDINIDGVIEISELENLSSLSERIIEVYCTIEDILSPN